MKLFKSFFVYTIVSFISAGIPFFLIPVLTNHLTTKDYGIITLYSSTVMLIMPFIAIGIPQLISVEYFKLSKNEFKKQFSSSLIVLLGSAAVSFIVIFLLKKYASNLINVPQKWILLIPFICLATTLAEIAYVLLRNKEKVIAYSILNIGQTLIEVIFTIVFVVVLLYGWQGRLISSLILSILLFFLSIFLFWHWKLLNGKISTILISGIVTFGLPIIPERLSTFVLNSSDKYFIGKMVDVSNVGIYSVATQISMVILILVNAFHLAYAPYVLKILQSKQNLAKIVKVFYGMATALLLATMLLGLFSPLVYKIFVGKDFTGGQIYVLWIALGYFFWGINVFFQTVILYFKKTNILMFISIIGILINLSLNYILIKNYGTIGAAYSTAISYFVICLLTAIYAIKIQKLPWVLNAKTLFEKQ